MGILGLFYSWMRSDLGTKKIHKTFENYVLSRGRAPSYKYRSLSLDLPGIIYEAVKEVWYPARHTKFGRPSEEEEEISLETLESEFYGIVKTRITNIVRLFNNRENQLEVLIIAIDGRAPVAKMQEQRKRRYMGSLEESRSFDLAQISPGTPFMQRLDKHLREWVRRSAYDGRKGDLPSHVIYSSYASPGEGEHKIMEYYRNQEDKSGYHILYGADNDLLLLSLVSPLNGIVVMKEFPPRAEEGEIETVGSEKKSNTNYRGRNKSGNEVNFIDIDKFKILIQEYGVNIYDYVFIMNFAGNDFLPMQPSFEILSDNMVHLMKTYLITKSRLISERIADENNPILVRNGQVIWQNFLSFLSDLRTIEWRLIVDNQEKMYEENGHRFFKFDSAGETSKIKDFEEFRSRWYSLKVIGLRKIDESLSDEEKQKERRKRIRKFEETTIEMSFDYLKSIAWITRYYYDGYVDWFEYYGYRYTPLIRDVYDTLDKNINYFVEGGFKITPSGKAEKGAYDMLDQLLAILPKKTIENILPYPYSTFPKKQLSEMFDYGSKEGSKDIYKYTRKSPNYSGPDNVVVIIPFADMSLIIKTRIDYENEEKIDPDTLSQYQDGSDTIVFRSISENSRNWEITEISKKREKKKEKEIKAESLYKSEIKIKKFGTAILVWKLSDVGFINLEGGKVNIPREKLTEKNKNYIIEVITEGISSGNISFPYVKSFMPHPKKLIHNETRARYGFYQKWNETDNTRNFVGERWRLMKDKHVILFDDDDYERIDIMTDYFTEDARMLGVFRGSKNNKLNAIEGFMASAPEIAAEAYNYAEKHSSNLDIKAIREGMYHAKVPICTTFKISVAIVINNLFKSRIVFDPFAGWGDRALGAMMADTTLKYIGTDPNGRLQKGHREIEEFVEEIYERKKSVKIYPLPIEELPLQHIFRNEKPDLVFSGPPYYDYEIYNTEGTQSHVSNKSEKEWTDWFHSQTHKVFDILKDEGHLVYYLGNCGSLNIPLNLIKYMNGIKYAEYLGIIPVMRDSETSFPMFCYVWKKLPYSARGKK